jgi:8-oxo-dGTP pyrophosphatase MutT (NUDIX family)
MNEEISVALKREVMEEAGAQVQLEQPVTFHQDYFFHKGKFFRTLLLFFTAKLIGASGTQSDPNMEPAGYYSREEIENLPMLGYVKNVIRDHFEK